MVAAGVIGSGGVFDRSSSSSSRHNDTPVFYFDPYEFVYDPTLEEELFSKGRLSEIPIFDAVRRRSRSEVEKMFKTDKSRVFDTVRWKKYNIDLLDIALGNNDLPMIDLIVQQQISQDSFLEKNCCISSKKLKLFMTKGFDVHRSSLGLTPLHSLIKGCNLPAIESLIEHVKKTAYPSFRAVFLPYLHSDTIEIVYDYHVPSEVNKLINISSIFGVTVFQNAITQIFYWKKKGKKWEAPRDISINIVKLLIHNEADLLKPFCSETCLEEIRSLTAVNGAIYSFQDEIRFAEAEQKVKENEKCVIC